VQPEISPARASRYLGARLVVAVIEEWQLSHGFEPRKEDYELACLLTAVVEQMHREGFNQMAEGPESEVK
jgi:hypothetical protein